MSSLATAATSSLGCILRLPHRAPLIPGRLLGRRKRFLADIRLDQGQQIVAHCVNPGRMEGLVQSGSRVWVTTPEPGTQRKLPHTWELVEHGGQIVGANTLAANRIVRALLDARCLRGLSRYDELRAEYPYGERSRVDFWCRQGKLEHYVEVKNCHLVYPDGRGYFPDSVSERATRHLHELGDVASRGQRATVLFVVQHPEVRAVRPSALHDPVFARAARDARQRGVSFRALRVRPTVEAYEVVAPIPVDLAAYDPSRLEPYRRANEPWSGSVW